MPLKTSSYLKTASLRWSRKTKSRELLSAHTISLPLGDFRHLSHIGLDAKGHHSFGDLSAFQSHQDLLQEAPPKPPRLVSPATEEVQRRVITAPPPGHKKSHSLPLLDELDLDAQQENIIPTLLLGEGRRSQEEAGGGDPQPAVGEEEDGGLRMKSQVTHNAPHPDEDPCCALSFDLGPSILDDVLQVMERHQ